MRIDCVEYSNPQEVAKKYNRIGKCNSKKCKGACCRFSIVNSESRQPCIGLLLYILHLYVFKSRYSHSFSKIKYFFPAIDSDFNPIFLKYSIPCRHFPIPSDLVYLKIANKCTYKFKTEKKEVKTIPEGI